MRPTLDGLRILENKEGLPWSVYVGVAGMPGTYTPDFGVERPLTACAGQTAYAGWKEYAKAKKGDTVFVTAGSGMLDPAEAVQIP